MFFVYINFVCDDEVSGERNVLLRKGRPSAFPFCVYTDSNRIPRTNSTTSLHIVYSTR